MGKILYKYPSRSRPSRFFESLDNIHKLSTHDDFEILCTFDLDDDSMTTPEVKDRLKQYPKVRAIYGTSTGKVSAINRDLFFAVEFDVLVLLSDDMHLLPGFDREILKAFEDGFSGLVHFPDGVANERLVTFPVMDKKYFDLFGFIYDPIYKSVFCDNHQHELAVLLGRYKYVPVNIVKHLHPAYGMASNDDLYRRNENPILYKDDHNTYLEQKKNNFFYEKYTSLEK